MIKNKVSRIARITLPLVLVVTMLAGCSETKQKVTEIEPMEAEEVNVVSYDFIGGEDVMPIGGFYGPCESKYSYNGEAQPNLITDEVYSALEEANINMVFFTDEDYNAKPAAYQKMFELGEKHGVGIFVKDSGVLSNLGENTLSPAEIGAQVSEYSKYPAFCGLYVIDEPTTESYLYSGVESHNVSNFGPLIKSLQELDINYYLNLLPLYDQTKRQGYNSYLEEVIQECNPEYLLYDFYVWDHAKSDYFYNLSTVRKYAQSNNIPFWTFIQAGSQFNDSAEFFDSKPYYPNENEFNWNVNTCLAYGAQGINYFPLVQPPWYANAKSQRFDFERHAMFGAWGNKNQWYYYAKNMNAQIAAVDDVLMNAKNKGVLLTCDMAKRDNAASECILEGDSWRELTSVTGDTLIGCFNYQGKTALYVVNYDTEYAQDITLNFYDTCNLSVVQKAEKHGYKSDSLTLSMQAGEGVLVVVES